MTKYEKQKVIKEYKQELICKIFGIIAIEALFVGGVIYNLI